MKKADKLYIAKTIFDYEQAIEETQENIQNTPYFERQMIREFGIKDGRPKEILLYQHNLSILYHFAHANGISPMELEELMKEYQTISFADYFALKKEVTIKEMVDELLVK